MLTNVTDLDPQATIDRYKSLADIERGFRVLKSEIEIGPVFHRLPQRIRAHAGICFMALVLYRVMRMRLHKSDTGLSPTRAMEMLRKIQYHQVRLNGAKPVQGISRINDLQSRLLRALNSDKPTLDDQLCLPL